MNKKNFIGVDSNKEVCKTQGFPTLTNTTLCFCAIFNQISAFNVFSNNINVSIYILHNILILFGNEVVSHRICHNLGPLFS